MFIIDYALYQIVSRFRFRNGMNRERRESSQEKSDDATAKLLNLTVNVLSLVDPETE